MWTGALQGAEVYLFLTGMMVLSAVPRREPAPLRPPRTPDERNR